MTFDPIALDAAALAAAYAPTALLLTKATIVLLAALAMSVAMSRATAGARHLLWLVTIVTLLLMPAVAAWAPLRLEILPAPVAARHVARDVVPPALALERDAGTDATGDAASTPAAPVNAASITTPAPTSMSPRDASVLGVARANPVALLLGAWALVAVFLLVRLAGAAATVRGIVRRAKPLDDGEWQAPLVDVSDRLGLVSMPRLLASAETTMPFACGLVTPTIVLPAECHRWSRDRRYAVLLHEIAHIERRDLVGHALGRITCALYWFHPLVWSAAKHLRTESERACDDLALASGARASDYAEHLLDIVSTVRRDSTPVVALAMARRKEFEGRMLAILDPDIRRARPSRLQASALTLGIGVMSLLVGAAAPAPRVATPTVAGAAPAPVAVTSTTSDGVGGATPAASETSRPDAGNAAATDVSASMQPPVGMSSEQRDDYKRKFKEQERWDASKAMEKLDKADKSDRTRTSEVTHTLEKIVDVTKVKPDKSMKRGDYGSALFPQARDDERPALLARVLRSDTSASLRRIAAWGLSRYAEQTVAAEALVDALRRDANPRVREMAAWSLGNADRVGSTAMEALSAALRDNDTHTRATAAWALGNSEQRGASDALAAALSDTSRAVRMRALWAIGQTTRAPAPRAVIDALRDRDANVRHLAAWALFEIQDPAAVSALESAMRAETNRTVQIGMLRALASTGERSVEAISRLLDSNDAEIRSMAVRALAGGQATGPWPWPWPEPRPSP